MFSLNDLKYINTLSKGACFSLWDPQLCFDSDDIGAVTSHSEINVMSLG
jgi:hypothetical protein